MQFSFQKYILDFKFQAGTSRGSLTRKTSYFIFARTNGGTTGIGECSLIPNLTPDENTNIEDKLSEACKILSEGASLSDLKLNGFPALRFGLETAVLDAINGGKRILFPSSFTEGEKEIAINGLVWMGNERFMLDQIQQKTSDGYQCLKLKVGALDFDTELQVLSKIRKQFGDEIEIRLDANGAFSAQEALEKLHALSAYGIHSIEQPIQPRQTAELKKICESSPIPVALDEELIGYFSTSDKENLLDEVNPAYVILKPGLHGGFDHCREWISTAEKFGVGWWITSALESNIGLNAIAQFAAVTNENKIHGLGTGGLFHNNIPSPLTLKAGRLAYHPEKKWDLKTIRR